MSSEARAWDASTYHTISGPQAAMAQAVLDRLELRGDEPVLDAAAAVAQRVDGELDYVRLNIVAAMQSDPVD